MLAHRRCFLLVRHRQVRSAALDASVKWLNRLLNNSYAQMENCDKESPLKLSLWKNHLVVLTLALLCISFPIFLLMGYTALYWAWLRANLEAALPYLPWARNFGMLAMAGAAVALGILFSSNRFPVSPNVSLFWFFIQAWAEKAVYLRNPHSNDEIDLPFEFAGTMLGFWMARVLTRPFDQRSEKFRSTFFIDFLSSGVIGLLYTLIVSPL